MDNALWIVQSLLAGIFLATGLIKLTQPRLKMAAGPMAWAADVTDGQFRTLGLLEVLGAIGLILPGALGIAPRLLPVAALGLVLVLVLTMIGAIVTHVRYGEAERLAVPIVLLGLALFVAVERFGAHSL
jgi:DoxX-like family